MEFFLLVAERMTWKYNAAPHLSPSIVSLSFCFLTLISHSYNNLVYSFLGNCWAWLMSVDKKQGDHFAYWVWTHACGHSVCRQLKRKPDGQLYFSHVREVFSRFYYHEFFFLEGPFSIFLRFCIVCFCCCCCHLKELNVWSPQSQRLTDGYNLKYWPVSWG
jgi:hypothetical protein